MVFAPSEYIPLGHFIKHKAILFPGKGGRRALAGCPFTRKPKALSHISASIKKTYRVNFSTI
jgi:hypothetical protein